MYTHSHTYSRTVHSKIQLDVSRYIFPVSFSVYSNNVKTNCTRVKQVQERLYSRYCNWINTAGIRERQIELNSTENKGKTEEF